LDLVEPRLDGDHGLGVQPEEPDAGVIRNSLIGDQPGLEQDPQVLGDRLPGDVEARRDLAGRALLVDQQGEQITPARLCEHLEHVATH